MPEAFKQKDPKPRRAGLKAPSLYLALPLLCVLSVGLRSVPVLFSLAVGPEEQPERMASSGGGGSAQEYPASVWEPLAVSTQSNFAAHRDDQEREQPATVNHSTR